MCIRLGSALCVLGTARWPVWLSEGSEVGDEITGVSGYHIFMIFWALIAPQFLFLLK